MADALNANARDLEAELEFFAQALDARLKAYFGQTPRFDGWPAPPDLGRSRSPYSEFLRRHQVALETRLLLLLALIPHVRPQLLDVLFTRNEAIQRGFSEFGGIVGPQHGHFLPTGETAAFLLAGDDLATRFQICRLFEPDHWLARERVLQLGVVAAGESPLGGPLLLSRECLHAFTHGEGLPQAHPADCPARQIHTELDWPDLVLPSATLDQLEEIKSWVLHSRRLLQDWQMARRLRPGFTALFHGPPGTGKTLTAALLGRHCRREVYKIDLSLMVSKYIGETEKNLARVFDLAERHSWLLFFDEADALFGKRTRVDDAHDRYANQEISYLLQRVEDFAGVVILATNFKANIDDAFLRRFQTVIHFPMPRPAERLRIWQEAFPKQATLEPGLELGRLADSFELSGGTILNVVRYAALRALTRDDTAIRLEDVEEGIRRELHKEGRAYAPAA